LGKRIHLPDLTFLKVVKRIITLYFTGKFGLESGGIEPCNGGGTTSALDQATPELCYGISKRSQGAKARNNYTFLLHVKSIELVFLKSVGQDAGTPRANV
jgi:hypothetical protein